VGGPAYYTKLTTLQVLRNGAFGFCFLWDQRVFDYHARPYLTPRLLHPADASNLALYLSRCARSSRSARRRIPQVPQLSANRKGVSSSWAELRPLRRLNHSNSFWVCISCFTFRPKWPKWSLHKMNDIHSPKCRATDGSHRGASHFWSPRQSWDENGIAFVWRRGVRPIRCPRCLT